MKNGILAMAMAWTISGCTCTGPFSPNDAAQICVTLQTCNPHEFRSLFGGTLESCTTEAGGFVPLPGSGNAGGLLTNGLEGPMHAIYSCLLSAHGDCSKAGACWALNGSPASCKADALSDGTCTGNVLSGCTADGQAFAIDCSKYGSTCGKSNVWFWQYSTCGVGACPPDSSALVCEGDKAEVCNGKLTGLLNCGAVGWKCQENLDSGVPECTGGAACDPHVQDTCDGTVAIQCSSDGRQSRFDCASQATKKRCESGSCALTGNACTSTTQPTCDGVFLTFCQDGTLKRFDCSAGGFGACKDGECLPK
jgi:hypothetical protein